MLSEQILMSRRRSRKKRSSGKKPWAKWLGFSALALVVLLVLGSFALYLGLKSYLHGERFRGMLAEEVGGVSQAEVEFGEFKWTGTSAYTETMRAHGFPEAGFSKIKAEGIETRVDFGAVRRGVWEIADLNIKQVNVLVDDKDRARRPFSVTSAESNKGEDGDSSGGGGLFARFIPDRVELAKAAVGELNVDAVIGEMRMTTRGMRLEIEPTASSEVFRVGARRGTVRIPDQPVLELEEADFRAGLDGVIIDSASLIVHDTGRLGVSGRIESADDGQKMLDVEVRLREGPADKILPEDWIKSLKGTIEADVEASGNIAEAPVLEGEIRLINGVLEAMPALDRIDEMLGSSKFRRLSFNDFEVRFERGGSTTKLTDFYARSAGSACLKGRANLPPDGGPSGRYMLGITPDTIKWLPIIKKQIIENVFKHDRDSAFSRVFGSAAGIEKPPEGFLWAIADIDPSAAEPYTADLRAQFFEFGGMAIWAELVGVSEQGLAALNLLTEAAKEKGVDAMAVLADGAGEGGLFAPDNLMRAAGELGVTAGMEKVMQDVIEGVGELPGSLIDAGSDLLKGLIP